MANMSKLRRFAQGASVLGEVAAIVGEVDQVTGSIENLSLSQIKFDPNNPRRLALSRDNPGSIDADDPDRAVKEAQLAELQELAASIAVQGLLQEVGVYRCADGYQLIWGERRVLACKLLGLETINVKLLPTRPAHLRAKQLIENMARTDLSLAERVAGIAAINEEEGEGALTSKDICALLGVGQAMAYRYLAIILGPDDVRDAVAGGVLTNLDQAAILAGIEDSIERTAALAMAGGDEGTAPRLEQPATPGPEPRKIGRGRPVTSAAFKTSSPGVVRHIVEKLLTPKEFAAYASAPWNDIAAAGDILKQVVAKIEKQVGGKATD